MFRLGMPELLVILAIAVLIFGPKRLPDLGRAVGDTIRGFKNAVKDEDDNPHVPAR